MPKDRYEFYVVKTRDNKIRLHITSDCPIAYTRKGQCSDCDQFLGLNPKLGNDGHCAAIRLFMSIDDFRSPRKCPDLKNKGGECTLCNKFLGFSSNSGFYCSAHQPKR